MINTENWHKYCLAGLLAGMLLLSVSCSSETNDDSISRPVSSKAAQPSVGIGRDIQETEAPAAPVEPKNYTICVDPGHGFVDGGTGDGVFEDGILEKDINLAVSKLLEEDLQQLGFKTIMTHNGVDLPAADTNKNKVFSVLERSAYVNTLDIDYFVSIHVNAYDDPSVYGMQIYYEQNWKKVNDWSETVANEIAASLDRTFPDYKTPTIWSDKTLEVTRETTAAASLIEIGFCTNETDRNNMTDPEWQAEFAQAVASGINQFFTDLES